MFKRLSTKQVYQNHWMRVYEDILELKSGSKGLYGYIERVDGVFAVVLNTRNEVLLIKQYRYPIGKEQWSIPGGASDKDNNFEEAVRREVLEETGVKLDKIEKIGSFYFLASCSTENAHLYLARIDVDPDLTQETGEDDEEITERRFVSIKEAIEMIDRGEITDAYSANAIQMVARRLSLL